MPFTQHPERGIFTCIYWGRQTSSVAPTGFGIFSKTVEMENESVCDALYSCDRILVSPLVFISLFSAYCSTKFGTQYNYEPKLWDGWLDCVNGIESDGFTELQSEAVSCCGSFMHAEPRLCLIGAQVSLQWLPNKFN